MCSACVWTKLKKTSTNRISFGQPTAKFSTKTFVWNPHFWSVLQSTRVQGTQLGHMIGLTEGKSGNVWNKSEFGWIQICVFKCDLGILN